MRLVCETVVKDVLPAVRSLIAKELQEKGYNQTEIAEILEITQPAVSQYLSAARGKKVQRIEDDEASYGEVQDLVELLLDDADTAAVSAQFCETCNQIRENDVIQAGFDGSEEMDSLCGFRTN